MTPMIPSFSSQSAAAGPVARASIMMDAPADASTERARLRLFISLFPPGRCNAFARPEPQSGCKRLDRRATVRGNAAGCLEGPEIGRAGVYRSQRDGEKSAAYG